MVQLVINSAVA